MLPSDSQVRYTTDNTVVSMLSLEHQPTLGAFQSQNEELNDFLLKDALSYQNLHLGTTYLLIRKSDNKLLAYITLSMGTFKLPDNKEDFVFAGKRLGDYPKDFPNQFPALLIGKLATERREEGRGAASLLFALALQIAKEQRQSIGCAFLMTHAYAAPEVINWYIGKEFTSILHHGAGRETVPMYFELGV